MTELTLVKGRTYRYQGEIFHKSVPKSVNADMAKYLMSTGHFEEKGSSKVKITKPEKRNKVVVKNGKVQETEKDTKDTPEPLIPAFRAKKELAEYADNEYNYKFEGDIKEMKMADMRAELEDHVLALKQDKSVVEV